MIYILPTSHHPEVKVCDMRGLSTKMLPPLGQDGRYTPDVYSRLTSYCQRLPLHGIPDRFRLGCSHPGQTAVDSIWG